MTGATLSIINKSDLIIDRNLSLVFSWGKRPRWEKSLDAHAMPVGRHPNWFHWEENRDQNSTAKIHRFCGGRTGPHGVHLGRVRRRCRRLPDHQDRHQPVLRQNERRRVCQG
ncbi:hypothetical protein MES4922_110241 [Mesorhizobium ventifaucium]|uniref:Uncharacterized protein n=1 Tax=Mesorhizobium ventifaucium TaxID=666020 RepID=A0ABN8JBU3_9HYPH|nr:hypothetical protein MES4922_110241 [Mesorhizobium ventifaucium]